MYKQAQARVKLIRTWYWLVGQAGISEDDWRAFLEGLYKKDRLHLLTTDELKQAVDEMVAKTGIELRKPAPPAKAAKEANVVIRNGRIIELPSKGQLASIEYYADKMQMSQETLQHMIKKSGGDPALSLMTARTLIEILKAMHSRGWKGNNIEERQPATGKDN